MKLDMDTIQFESRREIEVVSKALAEWHEKNKIKENHEMVERLIDLLEVMHMNW